MRPFAGLYYKVPFLWNGRACWKNGGGDIRGPAFIYYHPKGGYYLGARLIKPTADDWSGTKAWLMEENGVFRNLHCPWWSENPSVWRCITLTMLQHEMMDDLTSKVASKQDEIEGLQADLLQAKIQLDTATSMLQAEWDPMSTDGPSSSTTTFMAPTAKPAPKPSDDSQAGCCLKKSVQQCSLSGYIS